MFPLLVGFLNPLPISSGALAQPPAAAPIQDVQAAVVKWLDRDTEPGNLFRATLHAEDGSPLTARAINQRLFLIEDGELSIGIGFREPPRPESSLMELQSTFQHLALDRIPVPGVRAPGWETRLQTPRSSFREGVTLESWQDGVLRLRVRTTFFAVYGRRTDLEVPADAAMPPGSFFQMRRPIRADMLIKGKLL